MTDHELAEHLAAIRRHLPELADWHLDTAHVQLYIAGHPQHDGWHTFDRVVVEGWAAETAAPGQLPSAPPNPAHWQLIERARKFHHQEGECEIDYDAAVSETDEGVYVQAWVWVPPDGREPG